MTIQLEFRKSSYSAQGQECVEVAQVPATFYKSSYSGNRAECVEVTQIPESFQKSSHSGASQNCVEVSTSFRKSTHSAQGQECVEVADLPCGAAIRDSKHPDAGHLPFPSTEWTGFLSAALSPSR